MCSGGTWAINSLNDLLRGRYNVHSVEVPYIPYHLLIKIHRRGASRLVQLPFCKLRFCQTKAPTRKVDREGGEAAGWEGRRKAIAPQDVTEKFSRGWRSLVLCADGNLHIFSRGILIGHSKRYFKVVLK